MYKKSLPQVINSISQALVYKKPQIVYPMLQAAMHDSFNLTNIYPEKKRNIMWNALEVYIREKVLKDFADVRIFTGPIFRTDESAGVTSYGVCTRTFNSLYVLLLNLVCAVAKFLNICIKHYR